MIGKEACEVKLKRAAVGFFKSDSFEQTLVRFVFNRAFVDGVMNSAEVNKIESSSAKISFSSCVRRLLPSSSNASLASVALVGNAPKAV